MKKNGEIVQADDTTFDEIVLKSTVPALVDFWAPWCTPCHAVAPVFEELSREYAGRVKFVKVDVTNAQRIATAMGVMAIPNIVLFDRGEVVDRRVGVQPKSILEEMIEQSLRGSG
jgi:thioredoxin 1